MKIDHEDFEELLLILFGVTERVNGNFERNPYYGKVNTVRDLVMFMNFQPKKISE